MYFFLNYCPIQLIKKDSNGKSIRTIDFPKFWDGHYYKSHYLNQCRNEGHHAAELASRGKGKAHPYSQKILTPFGWKYWGDIQIGDYVYGDNGELTKVIDIPYDEVSDIYTVTLLDGRKIQCTDGHLFKVKNHTTNKDTLEGKIGGYLCLEGLTSAEGLFVYSSSIAFSVVISMLVYLLIKKNSFLSFLFIGR